MATVDELNARHGIGGVVRFENRHGLMAVVVTHAAAKGVVFLHGAHVTNWQPAGAAEVLWMSAKSAFENGKPIRGGVPICFPWFGPKAGNAAAPAHGTVRLRAWDVESVKADGGGVTVSLVTRSTNADLALFPHAFELRHRVSFGKTLTMALEIKNTGGNEATFEEALHTYFSVWDVKNVAVTGLEGAEYIDKTDGMKRKVQSGAVTIAAETDRPYLNSTAAVTIADPGAGRRIVVGKSGSNTSVVWNPWIAKAKAMADFGDEEWPGMLCVETCNVAENAVKVAAGATHVMAAEIRVEQTT